jgi:hypothetical protein
MIPALRLAALASIGAALGLACSRPRGSDPQADARGVVESRYAQHFKEGQVFSPATLRAREVWFTPRFYQLMLADMSGPSDEVGYIDGDLFTDSQETAYRYTVGDARRSHDTVYVNVDVQLDSTARERRRVVVAVVPAQGGWQIANFIDSSGDVAGGLLRAAQTPADRR